MLRGRLNPARPPAGAYPGSICYGPGINTTAVLLSSYGNVPSKRTANLIGMVHAVHLTPRTSCTRWEQVSGHDVQRWMVHLLTRYSDAYASNQFRALRQFFRWLAEEEQLPDPMTRLRAPKVSDKLVPVFTSEELSALGKTCQGRRFVPAPRYRDHRRARRDRGPGR